MSTPSHATQPSSHRKLDPAATETSRASRVHFTLTVPSLLPILASHLRTCLRACLLPLRDRERPPFCRVPTPQGHPAARAPGGILGPGCPSARGGPANHPRPQQLHGRNTPGIPPHQLVVVTAPNTEERNLNSQSGRNCLRHTRGFLIYSWVAPPRWILPQKAGKGLLFAGLPPSKEKSSPPESTHSPLKVLSHEYWGFGADSAGERAAVLSGRAEGSVLSLNGRQRKQPALDLPGRSGGAAGAKTWHGFVWASGTGCPANRPRCPLPSARTGPAVRETRPRRTVLRSSASRRARVRVPRRARLPAPPPTSRIKRGLYSGSTLDNDNISLTTLSSARRKASPGVQPPTCGGRARPPPGGHRDKGEITFMEFPYKEKLSPVFHSPTELGLWFIAPQPKF